MNEPTTPSFIFDIDIIDKNIKLLKNSLKVFSKSQLCYSVKTNNIPYLINHIYNKDVFIEVVSSEEYEYVIKNINPEKIVFNGPYKTEEDIKTCILNNSYINIDNLEELKKFIKFKKIIKENNYSKLGVRINIILDNIKDLIGYCNSRFGISIKEFDSLIKLLNKNNIKLNGIHFHINHNYEISSDYESVTKEIINLIKKYNLDLNFIDLGGGILRSVEGVNYKDILLKVKESFIKNNIDINNILIMIEPGAAITASCGKIISKVISKKTINNTLYLTLDSSKNYYDITNKFDKWNHYKIERKKKRKIIKEQIICGFTCMENDIMFHIQNEQELDIGDILIIEKVGSYSINFIPFFIKGIPKIYIVSKDKVIKEYSNKTIGGLYYDNN